MRKRFLVPMVFLIILISSSLSFGFSVAQQIKVYYRSIHIVHNGERLTLEKQPFIYEGHIYVPLRFVAESLGYKIGWDEERGTAYLSDQDRPEIIPPSDPLAGESFVYGQITRIDYEERKIHLEQHLDDNSRDLFDALVVEKDAVVLLQRNQHQWNISFADVKVGDVAGFVLTKDGTIRGIIVSN